MIRIAVINESTVVKDADVQACVTALQVQVSRDFAPVWGIDAQINFHPSKVAPEGAWQLVILDDSDQADALGYHELTVNGQPLGKVFAASDLLSGNSWTVTVSHELLEMLADADVNDAIEVDNPDGSMSLLAKEPCDPVEADSLGYKIDGVLVSDFVYPQWFMAGASGEMDFVGHITKPLTIAPGGYIGVLQVAAGGPGWQQIAANLKLGGPAAARGSRRWRRSLPDSMYRRSKR